MVQLDARARLSELAQIQRDLITEVGSLDEGARKEFSRLALQQCRRSECVNYLAALADANAAEGDSTETSEALIKSLSAELQSKTLLALFRGAPSGQQSQNLIALVRAAPTDVARSALSTLLRNDAESVQSRNVAILVSTVVIGILAFAAALIWRGGQ